MKECEREKQTMFFSVKAVSLRVSRIICRKQMRYGTKQGKREKGEDESSFFL